MLFKLISFSFSSLNLPAHSPNFTRKSIDVKLIRGKIVSHIIDSNRLVELKSSQSAIKPDNQSVINIIIFFERVFDYTRTLKCRKLFLMSMYRIRKKMFDLYGYVYASDNLGSFLKEL